MIRQTVQHGIEEGAKKNIMLSQETEELKVQLLQINSKVANV
jgi:hypothetical protein